MNRSAATGTIGLVSGALPHVLHHVGPLAGAEIFAGIEGTLIFGLVGIAFSLPFLFRLHQKFKTVAAPLVALAAFTVMYLVSSLYIGPTIQPLLGPGPAVHESAGHGH